MVVSTGNISVYKTEAGGCSVQSLPGLCSEIPVSKSKHINKVNINMTKRCLGDHRLRRI